MMIRYQKMEVNKQRCYPLRNLQASWKKKVGAKYNCMLGELSNITELNQKFFRLQPSMELALTLT